MTKLLLLTSVLAAASLSALPVPGLSQASTSEMQTDPEILHCLQVRRSEPNVAVDLAEALLARPGLSDEDRIKVLSCKGLAVAIVGKADEAIAAANEIRELMGRHPDLPPEFQLRAWSNMGSILHTVGEMHQAVVAYTKASDAARGATAEDAGKTQASILTNIGLIHADYLDSPEIADRYYREAMAFDAEGGRISTNLSYNLGRNLVRLWQMDEATEFLASAAADESIPLVQHRARAELARILTIRGELGGARALLDQSLSAQLDMSDTTGQANTLAVLADWHLASGDPPAALEAAERAWALVGESSMQLEKVLALKARLYASAALGRTQAVLALADELHTLQINALKSQRLELLADLQASTSNADSERQLMEMRHDAEVQALQLGRSELIRNTVLGVLVLVLLGAAVLVQLQRRRNRLLRAVSSTDPLTGLRNRQACTEALNAMGKRKPGVPGLRHAVFLIDIDHFKRINDLYGHHAGDNVLAQVAQRLEAACRPGDVVARWGGEEFLVACPELTQDKACGVAARLIAALDCHIEVLPERSEHLTVSLGFAPFPFFRNIDAGPAGRWEYALRMADRALYAAKDRRDAWTGMWGAKLEPADGADDVLENPDQAVREGMIDVVASYTLAAGWRAGTPAEAPA